MLGLQLDLQTIFSALGSIRVLMCLTSHAYGQKLSLMILRYPTCVMTQYSCLWPLRPCPICVSLLFDIGVLLAPIYSIRLWTTPVESRKHFMMAYIWLALRRSLLMSNI